MRTENKFLSFFFTGLPVEKLDDWFCYVDAELQLLHPRNKQKKIQFSGVVVLTTVIEKNNFYGWDNFATWDEVEPFVDREDKDKIKVEVIIRNQMLFTVSNDMNSITEPIPTRKQMDHFIRPLFNSNQFADVHLQIGAEEQVPAHKLVLAAKSRLFQDLLYEKHVFDRVIDLKERGIR